MNRWLRCSPEERAQRERLDSVYARAQSPVMRTIERSVCGCDYGGTSWTTRAEAERMAADLALRPGLRLLDLGAGSGWPGLYLARTSGCEVVLADLPLSGIRIAGERAGNDGISGSVWAAVADAAALPFAGRSFDAISHSDLLCCLRRKRAVLAACRRALRRHGRMAFTVISIAPGLAPEGYRRALASGPEFVETEADYATLLARTGWDVLGREDVTAGYAASLRRQVRADEAHREGLLALIGAGEFAERQADWRAKLAALGEGLLRREYVLAAPY